MIEEKTHKDNNLYANNMMKFIDNNPWMITKDNPESEIPKIFFRCVNCNIERFTKLKWKNYQPLGGHSYKFCQACRKIWSQIPESNLEISEEIKMKLVWKKNT